MYTTFAIIALTLLTAYIVTLCAVNLEIPKSLSATVFYLPPGGRWLWTAVIFLSGFMLMVPLTDACSESTKILAIFAIVALMLTGAAPLVKDDSDTGYKIHMGAAVACGVLSQAVVAINQPWLLLGWLPWVAAFVWITKDGRWRTAAFFAEITCILLSFALIFI